MAGTHHSSSSSSSSSSGNNNNNNTARGKKATASLETIVGAAFFTADEQACTAVFPLPHLTWLLSVLLPLASHLASSEAAGLKLPPFFSFSPSSLSDNTSFVPEDNFRLERIYIYSHSISSFYTCTVTAVLSSSSFL